MSLLSEILDALRLKEEQQSGKNAMWANIAQTIGGLGQQIAGEWQEGKAQKQASSAYDKLLEKSMPQKSTAFVPRFGPTPTEIPGKEITGGDIRSIAMTKHLPREMMSQLMQAAETSDIGQRYMGLQKGEQEFGREEWGHETGMKELEGGIRQMLEAMEQKGSQKGRRITGKFGLRKQVEANKGGFKKQVEANKARIRAAEIAAGAKGAVEKKREEEKSGKGLGAAKKKAAADALEMKNAKVDSQVNVERARTIASGFTTSEEQDTYLWHLVKLGKLRKSEYEEIVLWLSED